ncbi:MAG: hydrogenase maturation nickel metallochaperone HypA [Erysipelotrichaceae bacterium]|nr:hydrogenase maturation nickel metallochaperone HypA [Erysipelotrichaceae bacterium]MBO4537742.1 hydrogenase maturation nickel metallochaperone HypA [Erysipelotrichaceae bacterium]
MHELGIVFHIIRQVDEVAEENKVTQVRKVTLEIGEVSGVIPHYLQECWKWACLNKSSYMKDCQLEIVTLKATSFCEDCRRLYDTAPGGRICPYCQSTRTYLVTGNEVSIRDIEVV